MRWLALTFAMVVAGCTSNDDSFEVLRAGLLPNQQGLDPRYLRAEAQNPEQLKIALLEFDVATFILFDSARDGVVTWITPDGASVATKDQMIVNMRGFGSGLMAVDADQTLSMLRSGRRGITERFHSFLTGDDKIETRTYRCQLADEGQQELVIGTSPVMTNFISEDCRSLDQSFLNLYWVIPGNNRIVQTSQWTGEFIGMVATQVVP